MHNTALPVNRHPVDQLADIRAAIKALQEQEDTIRTEVSVLMGDGDVLGGDEFIARQTISERAGSIDAAALERDGIDVAKYRKKPSTVYSIKVERRAQEAA